MATWVFFLWQFWSSSTRGRCSPLSTLGGGGWEISSWVRISWSVSVKLAIPSHWVTGSPVARCPCLARRWQSANISPMSVVVTQHITDLLSLHNTRETPRLTCHSSPQVWCNARIGSFDAGWMRWQAIIASLDIIVFQPKHLDTTTPSLMKTTQTEQRRDNYKATSQHYQHLNTTHLLTYVLEINIRSFSRYKLYYYIEAWPRYQL